MARKTKEDALETRNRLLDAAEKVFYDKGFAATSLMDVAKAADLSRGAVYWHFKNKSDLLDAMADRVRLPFESLSDMASLEDDANPLETLRLFSVQILRESVRNPRRRRVLSILFHRCELSEETRHQESRRQTACIEYVNHFDAWLQRAVKANQLPADLDTRQAAVAKWALITGLLSNWLFLPGSYDLESLAEPMIDSYFCMLQHSPALRSGSRQYQADMVPGEDDS